ncbi:MAG: type II toxin-antitoxin system VapC family toxin [Alphaproteobacteria bacterium]|nr:type II toxin-antitoxin system VapC family toxin [Alphaproteobacteria bacterium]
MIFLLDTNVVIALLNGKPREVRSALLVAKAAGHGVAITSIVLHELWFGISKSSRRAENAEALQKLLAEGFESIAFDDSDAEVAGQLRAELANAGTPVGPYDLLIAAQALRREATLVTANEREFARVQGLRWTNWAA